MNRILVVNEDMRFHEEVLRALKDDSYSVWWAPDGGEALALVADVPVDVIIADYNKQLIELLESLRSKYPNVKSILIIERGTPAAALNALRGHVCDFLVSPFTAEELRAVVKSVLGSCPAREIEVVSAQPEWVELSVPCDRGTLSPLQKLLTEIETDVPPEMTEAMSYAFIEMLSNAIEHGCKLNPAKRVQVSILRLKRAVICWIKDPGDGFNPAQLEHAAVNNPSDDPLRHVAIREEKGLRGGGFGILMTKQLVDDLVYNERHNELMFVKFLS